MDMGTDAARPRSGSMDVHDVRGSRVSAGALLSLGIPTSGPELGDAAAVRLHWRTLRINCRCRRGHSGVLLSDLKLLG
jgi:hypothetical protein